MRKRSQQKCIVVFALVCCFAILVALIFSAVDIMGEDEDGLSEKNCQNKCRVASAVAPVPEQPATGEGVVLRFSPGSPQASPGVPLVKEEGRCGDGPPEYAGTDAGGGWGAGVVTVRSPACPCSLAEILLLCS
ncbi:hypothetical protein PANDA_021784 [Ailuropoda melanoleuca]|uniref:Uncharacterized protein n=1 Tax=Ailuropoda melanoleuca TaxID=9646 RepID=D2I799_AILME|nr:hypothetical protein PANDA_021784 [Ailuropoda melanoleuca]